MLKKILAVVLLLAVAVVCVACTRNTPAQTAETKKYTYTIINETGTTVTNVYLADDHSANKAEVKFDGEGMDDGAEVSLSVSAVPDKDGNPSLTASYTIGATESLLPESKRKEKSGLRKQPAFFDFSSLPHPGSFRSAGSTALPQYARVCRALRRSRRFR